MQKRQIKIHLKRCTIDNSIENIPMEVDHEEIVESIANKSNNLSETENQEHIDFLTNNIDESSFEEERETTSANDNSFKVFEKGSQKGKPLLVHNGFSYTIKVQRKNYKVWRCSGKNKQNRCPGSVIENSGSFTLGGKDHNHSPKKNLKAVTGIKVELKEASESNYRSSAKRIVEDVFLHQENSSNLPKMINCKEMVNYHRRKFRPKQPDSLMFILDHTYVPDNFLQKDISAKNERILIFGNETQLQILAYSKLLYMDGTFKVVKYPFKQLFTIHTFLKKNGDLKQVPMLFAFLSSKKKTAYSLLFKVNFLKKFNEKFNF